MTMSRIELAKGNFIVVRDCLKSFRNGTSAAYRNMWKKPMKFYREHTPKEATEILIRESVEFLS